MVKEGGTIMCQTTASPYDTLRERILKRIDADDFTGEFSIVENREGFFVMGNTLGGRGIGPFPTEAKAQEELSVAAQLLKGAIRLYWLQMEE